MAGSGLGGGCLMKGLVPQGDTRSATQLSPRLQEPRSQLSQVIPGALVGYLVGGGELYDLNPAPRPRIPAAT